MARRSRNKVTQLALVISRWDPQPWIDRFTKVAPDLDVCRWPDETVAPDDIDYALAWQPPEGVLAGFPNLKAIFSLGAGVDHILSEPQLPDVPLVRVVDPDLTMRMSEYVCLHVLMHHRQHVHIMEVANDFTRTLMAVVPRRYRLGSGRNALPAKRCSTHRGWCARRARARSSRPWSCLATARSSHSPWSASRRPALPSRLRCRSRSWS